MTRKDVTAKGMTEETPQFDHDEYNKVVSVAKLLSVQVSKVDFDVKVDFFNPDLNKALHLDRAELGTHFDPDGNIALGRFRFSVAAKASRKTVLKGSAEYLVVYEMQGGADEEAAKAFCSRVGVFAAYPYFRALMAHLSWASDTKLPPIPVIATRGSPIRSHSPQGTENGS
jgi:hypothetical protein